MRKLWGELHLFFTDKLYMLILSLTAACGYGFAVTHYSIGIDDTAIELYFGEGLAPYVGRWTLFVLNKLFAIDAFAPWMVELVSVLLLGVSVTLWCILFRRICEGGYGFPCGAMPFRRASFSPVR